MTTVASMDAYGGAIAVIQWMPTEASWCCRFFFGCLRRRDGSGPVDAYGGELVLVVLFWVPTEA